MFEKTSRIRNVCPDVGAQNKETRYETSEYKIKIIKRGNNLG